MQNKEYQAEYYRRNKEKMRANNARWKSQNRARINAKNAKNRNKNILHCSKRDAKKGNYAPCTATVFELETSFTGFCFVCDIQDGDTKSTRLLVDHCHTTGQFRGWLCNSCNCALGFAKDSTERLEQLIAYLRKTAKG